MECIQEKNILRALVMDFGSFYMSVQIYNLQNV